MEFIHPFIDGIHTKKALVDTIIVWKLTNPIKLAIHYTS